MKKMEIKKYKTKIQAGTVNFIKSLDDLKHEILENDLRLMAVIDNEICLSVHGQEGIRYSITLDSKDILKLMTGVIGQEKHKEEQKRHEEKLNQVRKESQPPPTVLIPSFLIPAFLERVDYLCQTRGYEFIITLVTCLGSTAAISLIEKGHFERNELVLDMLNEEQMVNSIDNLCNSLNKLKQGKDIKDLSKEQQYLTVKSSKCYFCKEPMKTGEGCDISTQYGITHIQCKNKHDKSDPRNYSNISKD